MVRALRGLVLPAVVLACFQASCRSSGDGDVADGGDVNVGDDGPMGARARDHTPLRPNDAGQVRAIGATCRPEDGWQYVWPAPPEAPDGGGPHTAPIPPDYKETHQLEPGIGYCRQGTYQGGFFTSNCGTDSDCPLEARCDHGSCGVACLQDSDCRPDLYCPPRPSGTRFCAPGCPVSRPPEGYDCYEGYGGPWTCSYPTARDPSPGASPRSPVAAFRVT